MLFCIYLHCFYIFNYYIWNNTSFVSAMYFYSCNCTVRGIRKLCKMTVELLVFATVILLALYRRFAGKQESISGKINMCRSIYLNYSTYGLIIGRQPLILLKKCFITVIHCDLSLRLISNKTWKPIQKSLKNVNILKYPATCKYWCKTNDTVRTYETPKSLP